MSLKKHLNFDELQLRIFAALLACIPQAIATSAAWNRFQYEELAESIRNPFWLSNHSIYDGVSSNIGWYGFMAAFYRVFGFALASGKTAKLLIWIVAIFFLIDILRKFLSWSRLWLPLFLISLSPTLLYFNTTQASYGIDLPFAIICLSITLRISKTRKPIILCAILGMVSAWASMCYGTFLFCIPSLGLTLLTFYRKPAGILLGALVFILVPILSSLYLEHPALLFNDPKTQAGLFRGGGGAMVLDWQVLITGLSQTCTDLFSGGTSYYFPLHSVEFGGALGLLCFLLLSFSSVLIFLRQPKLRVPIAIGTLLIVLSLVIPNLSEKLPGLRRNTPALAGFYAVVVLLWLGSTQVGLIKWKTRLIQFSVFLLLLHHLIGFSGLYWQLSEESLVLREPWLKIAITPRESLEIWKNKIEKGQPLSCEPTDSHPVPNCRYSELFAALAADQYWNQKKTPKVMAIDPNTKNEIELRTKLWDDYIFSH